MSRRRALVAAALAIAITTLLGPGRASAHPLGNFSVNHAHALTFTADRIVDEAIVDYAEIPTAQSESDIDRDGDGTSSADELAAYGAAQCQALRAAVELTVDSAVLALEVTRTSFQRLRGAAGLTTTRLECRLEGRLDVAGARSVRFDDQFERGRIGWREITAVGDGVELSSPVPARSPSDGLRNYPVGLLDSPPDVRTAEFVVAPGIAGTELAPADDVAATAGDRSRSISDGGPFGGLVDGLTRTFDDLIGTRDLTLGVGITAVALAVLLGASHALLPGHGKTVIAAYIAGRQGTARDAVIVGATVTATHTGGVLLLGLALTISSSLAGETVLAWLGIASGLLIAVLGASLLVGSARRRPSALHHGHSHGPGHHHHRPHQHHHHTHAPWRTRASVHAGDDSAGNDGSHGSVRSDSRPIRRTVVTRRAGGSNIALLERTAPATRSPVVVRRAAPAPAGDAPSEVVPRRALVGMGIAGGLVPSPSALIVLLSAIALGRTAFGVLLVIGYGLGMAATLTAAGLLFVRLRDRYERRRAGRAARRIGAAAARWRTIMPFATAVLVLVVGLGIATRSLGQLS